MTPNLVSTIIPVFNRAEMLREAVDSVMAQSWRPIEIVIVDDGSLDGTLQAAQALAVEHKDIIRVISQDNAGPGVARQTGLGASLGEFIQFLDSDDLLLPHKFALQVAGLRGDPEAGISYGKTYTRENGVRNIVPAQRSGERHRTVFPALLTGRLWETSTPLYRRRALELIGPWPTKRQMEDWEFDAQAGAAGIQLQHCDEWIAEYVIHGEHRLASAWRQDDVAFGDMVDAHLAILLHARSAGIAVGSEPLTRFARTLFWLARACAARGKVLVAMRLLDAAASAAPPGSATTRELTLYRAASRICGWRNVARVCTWRDRLSTRPVAHLSSPQQTPD